ncbi:hypothetical protein ACFQ2M_00035 [Kitasatospora saccharophila]|uniref:hypothetical protein n=1 Tax=Kitasatospora saccharophila TaxID=407973 RepID=UPI00362599D4
MRAEPTETAPAELPPAPTVLALPTAPAEAIPSAEPDIRPDAPAAEEGTTGAAA